MAETRQYEYDGLTIDIPIYFDERSKIYIEDYPDFVENPVWTGSGYRVLFCGMDSCPVAERVSPGICRDCGTCKYFMRAAERTWFGCCTNKNSPINLSLKQEDK